MKSKEDILSKCHVVLDMNKPDFMPKFMDAGGFKTRDNITIITPQFQRDDGLKITEFPKTVEEFDALRYLYDEDLQKLGLQKWDDNGHWLFPYQWYDNIPNGYPIVSISGETELFIKGETDDDMRFGALAYGFIKLTKE